MEFQYLFALNNDNNNNDNKQFRMSSATKFAWRFQGYHV